MSRASSPRSTFLSSGRSRGLAAGGVVLLLAIGLYLVGFFVTGDRVPRDVTVAGVAIGGLGRDDAIAKLQSELQPRLGAEITVTADDQQATIKGAESGIGLDYAATVDEAGIGKSPDPRRIWTVLTGGGAVQPVITTDQQQLDRQLDRLQQQFGKKPVDAEVKRDGIGYTAEPMTVGREVDRAQAQQRLLSQILQPGAIAIPVREIEPEITDAEAEQLITEQLEPALAGPVTVDTDGNGNFKVWPDKIRRALVVGRADGKPTMSIDAEKLRSAADNAIKRLDFTEPKDATVRLVNGEPKVIPGEPGGSISAEDLAAAVQPVLTKPVGERNATVELTQSEPEVTTADARDLGVEEVTGEFTTHFPYAEYRNHNIGRAAEILNNTLVMPGEVFSFNDTVGERTAENGFVAGTIISGGIFKKEMGGGVSQSVTTTFNAAFFAGMKDVEHHPHTLYIDRYPAGREATVAWPTLDLKFKNTTEHAVLIQAFVDEAEPGSEGSVTVKMWSTKSYDKITSTEPQKSGFSYGQDITSDDPNCEPSSPVQGFHVTYSRLFFNDGKRVKKEDFAWTYNPTNRVTCV